MPEFVTRRENLALRMPEVLWGSIQHNSLLLQIPSFTHTFGVPPGHLAGSIDVVDRVEEFLVVLIVVVRRGGLCTVGDVVQAQFDHCACKDINVALLRCSTNGVQKVIRVSVGLRRGTDCVSSKGYRLLCQHTCFPSPSLSCRTARHMSCVAPVRKYSGNTMTAEERFQSDWGSPCSNMFAYSPSAPRLAALAAYSASFFSPPSAPSIPFSDGSTWAHAMLIVFAFRSLGKAPNVRIDIVMTVEGGSQSISRLRARMFFNPVLIFVEAKEAGRLSLKFGLWPPLLSELQCGRSFW